ncbi:hypothetical protein Hanom_Chr10g00904861 [Helianthus anomalus]
MDLPNFIPPITSPHRNHRQLRQNNRTPNRSRNLLRTLHPQTHVPVPVTHHHKRLEPGSLTGPGLFLNRHDFHDLVFEAWEDLVDDLVLFDWERMEVDLLKFCNPSILNQSTKFGNWYPFFFFGVTAPATAASAAVATTASSAAESSAESAAFSSSFCHGCCC